MGRLLLVALLCGGCNDVYSMLVVDPGDGGPPATSTTGIGGSGGHDGGVNFDLNTGPALGVIVAHSAPSASFISASGGSDGCASSQVERCLLTECPSADLSVAGTVADFGNIFIKGGIMDLALVPQNDGRYLTESFAGPIWPAKGAELTLSASGGSYDPFTAIVDGPSAVEITVPLAQSQLDLPRGADFNLAWTGGTSGVITFELAVAGSRLQCDFLRINQSGTVSHLALGKLPPGNGTLTINDTNRATADQGIAITVETPALDSNGVPFSVPVNVH